MSCAILGLDPSASTVSLDTLGADRLMAVAFDLLPPAGLTSAPYSAALDGQRAGDVYGRDVSGLLLLWLMVGHWVVRGKRGGTRLGRRGRDGRDGIYLVCVAGVIM